MTHILSTHQSNNPQLIATGPRRWYQETKYYLNQCSPRSMTSKCVTSGKESVILINYANDNEKTFIVKTVQVMVAQHQTLVYKLTYVQKRHATQAKAGLSGTWAEADRPKPRCTWQIHPVFCTDLNLFYSIHFPFFFLCGFGWGNCRSANMHSALWHCPL